MILDILFSFLKPETYDISIITKALHILVYFQHEKYSTFWRDFNKTDLIDRTLAKLARQKKSAASSDKEPIDPFKK